jgi:hypothetical protein
MKITYLKKLIKEVADEIVTEGVNVQQALQKLEAFEKTLGGKKASILISREGSSPNWSIIANVVGQPDKVVELATGYTQENAMKMADEIIKGHDKIVPLTQPYPTADLMLSRFYTVTDSGSEVGESNNVKKLYDMMTQASYPNMEEMTPEDRKKYLAYLDKQPRIPAGGKWTGD